MGDTFPPFTVQLDDPAGNSFIEFLGSTADPKWNLRTYARTHAQNVALGIAEPDDVSVESDPNAIRKMKEAVDKALAEESAGEIKDDEIFVFPGSCSSCNRPLDTLMKKVNIPYFKVRGQVDHFQHHLSLTPRRISSSCRQTVTHVVIETTKSSLDLRSLRRGRRSSSRSRIGKISVETF